MINLHDVSLSSLRTLSLEHFDILNPIKKDGFLKKSSLIYKLLDFKDSLDDKDEKEIVEFILGKDFNNLIVIITGIPSQLEQIAVDFETKFDTRLVSIVSGKTASLTRFGEEIKKIFDYEKYRASDFCMKTLHNLRYNESLPCPYCNLETIEVIEYTDDITLEDKKQALLDLDHFYPRSRFPFFALSFFNLVPSCNKCNQRIKKDLNFRITTHINPFDRAFDDYFEFSTDKPIQPNNVKNDFNVIFKQKSFNGTIFPDDTIRDLRLISRLETKKKRLTQFVKAIDRHNDGKSTANILFDANGLCKVTIKDTLEDYGVTSDRNDIHKHQLSKIFRDIYSTIK